LQRQRGERIVHPHRRWVTEKENSPLSGQLAILEAQNKENRAILTEIDNKAMKIEAEYAKTNLIMAEERAERLAQAYYKTKRGCFEESLEPEL
jgi:hypothetical protein